MKKFLSLVLALVMTMSLVTISAGAKSFTDNSKITYKEAVDVVSAIGIVDGYEDGAFNPTNTLTRGAAAKIICNLILGPTTASALSADTAPYKDVPTTNNFAGYIAYCSQQGIISGYADGTFRPAATLTGYAFMKMLLGALGYDAEKENYVGANWSVQVGKQAIGIGLDDGNDKFVGTQAVTREEACLYAFNTLQATMVEYENQSQIVIGDITVNTSSKYKDMANTSKTDGYINNNDKMEFAEKYFTDLKLKDGTDDFARPANVWTLKADEIGTYPKTADATYTAEVEVGDIYKDLGLSKTVDKADVSVYVDGEEHDKITPVAIKKGDDNNKYGANGVLTEVFYDDDDGTVVITEVNTFVGQVNKTVAATSKKDAYVQIATLDALPDNVKGNLDFETNEEFEDEDYVLYTYSQSAEEVKSVATTEEVSGTVTKVVNKVKNDNAEDNKKLTIDGTEYKASKNLTGEEMGDVSIKNDYTVYLDAYGYIIYIEEAELSPSDYALVLATAANADTGNLIGKKAELLFADGTTKVVTTEKHYALKDKIVTYKVDSDGVYTLKEVKDNGDPATMSNTTDTDTFAMKNDKASITVKTGTGVTANSKSVFVVRDTNDAEEYTSYTGIKNAPTINAGSKDNEDVTVYYYCKSNKMVTVMFILPDTGVEIEDDSNKLLFLAGGSASNKTYDGDDVYYEYNAIVNNEITTVKVDEDVSVAGMDANDLNGLFKSYSSNKRGVITKLSQYADYDEKTEAKQAVNGVTGVDKRSADYTVILGNGKAAQTITVADDVKVFAVNKDGDISVSSYRSVAKDETAKAYAMVQDYLVQTLVVETVESKDDAQAPKVSVTSDATNHSATIGETVTLTADVELNDKKNDKIEGYQWYVNTADTMSGAEKIKGATSATYEYKTAGVTADDYYFFCEVTIYNNKVNDADTAVGRNTSGYKLTVAEAAPETMEVIVNFETKSGEFVADDVVTVNAPATGSTVTVKAEDAKIPDGYVVVGADSKRVAFSSTDPAEVSFVVAAKVTKIEVTTEPTSTEVTSGENFNAEGMVVTATYSDGTSADVTSKVVLSGNTNLSVAGNVTITYTENGVEVTTTVAYTIAP